MTFTDTLIQTVREGLPQQNAEWRLTDGRYAYTMGDPEPHKALDALAERLTELESIDRSTWREGMVTVYDHEGTYVGCMGRESWEWLLAQGYESVRERIERTEALAARYEEALRWIEGLDRDLDRRGSVRLDEICEVARVALEEDA